MAEEQNDRSLFMRIVRLVQKGIIPKSEVPDEIGKAAEEMSPEEVEKYEEKKSKSGEKTTEFPVTIVGSLEDLKKKFKDSNP